MRAAVLTCGAAILSSLSWSGAAAAKDRSTPLVRLAEIEIDPAQSDRYEAELKAEIAESVNSEPGVLAIYAVAERDDPAKLHLFEIYADEAGYRAHIASPHFKRYKAATQGMIRSLKLIDTVPVLLGTKQD